MRVALIMAGTIACGLFLASPAPAWERVHHRASYVGGGVPVTGQAFYTSNAAPQGLSQFLPLISLAAQLAGQLSNGGITLQQPNHSVLQNPPPPPPITVPSDVVTQINADFTKLQDVKTKTDAIPVVKVKAEAIAAPKGH
jgi:hypothetical protein